MAASLPLNLCQLLYFFIEIKGIELKIRIIVVFLLDLLPYGLDYALFSCMDLSKVSVPLGFFMSYNEWLNQLELRVNHTLYRLYTIPQKSHQLKQSLYRVSRIKRNYLKLFLFGLFSNSCRLSSMSRLAHDDQ